ncbi:MAG: cell division protein FtsX [Janthinobacterium lividum]
MPEAADRGAGGGEPAGGAAGRSARAARRRRFDALGLRRALSDRLLPGLVAAMAFLAALALAGAVAASSLASRWREGAGAVLTVQVPDPLSPSVAAPGVDRVDAVRALLGTQPGVAAAHLLGEAELGELLRPWLGAGGTLSLPLPGVIEVRLRADAAAEGGDGLAARLSGAAPGTLVERNGDWMRRLGALARSLQACAAAALLVVAGVAAAVVAVATRAGLSARRDAIGIVHGLGATDGFIAGRFAARATLLASGGAGVGALAALPVLLGLASLAAPFAAPAGADAAGAGWLGGLGALPATIWGALPALPLAAAAIGWGTAQFTVRRWLRRLP